MNKLLERQIKKYLSNPASIPGEFAELLAVVSESYDHHEKERKMLERSIELTSDELINLNRKLETEAEELRVKEKHLSISQHIAHVGSWEYDEVSGQLYWSDETYRIYGFEPRAVNVTAALFDSLMHPDDVAMFNDTILQAKQAGNSYSVIHRLKNGKTVHERAEITYDDSGRALKRIGTVQDISERISKDNAIRNSEVKFRMLIENSTDGILIVDADSNIMFASDSCTRILGYTSEELIGACSLNQIYSEDYPKMYSSRKKLLMTPGKTETQVYRRVKKDGTVIWCEGVLMNLLEQPEVAGVVINFRDITDRIEANKALLDNEHKFSALIQNSTDAITVVDADSNVVFASDSVLGLTGFTPEETIHANTFDVVHPDDLPVLKKRFAEVMEHYGSTITAEYRRRKKDGSYMWCEGTAINLLHDHVIKGIVINFRDITERKNHENALKYTELRLRALLENSSEAIILANEELDITYASDSLYRVAGYRPEEIVGEPILKLAHPDEKDMLVDFMQDVISHPGEPKKLIYKTRKKDGSYIWCERVSTNFLSNPAINGIVSNFRDITERLEQMEALQQSNAELQKRNEELDRFVYSVSHDLRAPLTSILGLVEISRYCETRDEFVNNLNMIQQGAQKLDCFIFDILNYSKNSRVAVEEERIDFVLLLDEVINNLKYLKGDSIAVRLEKMVQVDGDFYTDKYRLSVVLNNIISNAIKYSKPGYADAYVRIHITADDTHAQIVVEDNGIGIAGEHHPKIFDMFFRATTVSMGSGLGLYIVEETLQKIGGSISFQSQEGTGSLFSIEIPNRCEKMLRAV